MKKFLAASMVAALAFSVSACGKGEDTALASNDVGTAVDGAAIDDSVLSNDLVPLSDNAVGDNFSDLAIDNGAVATGNTVQ